MNYQNFVYVSLSKLGGQQSGLDSDIRVEVMSRIPQKVYCSSWTLLRYVCNGYYHIGKDFNII